MRPARLLPIPFLLVACPALAQAPVRYDVRFENAAHHEAQIRVTFPDLEPGTLETRMSRTSPGRYALHEFAKNVYDVRAWEGAGGELEISRPDPHQWNVSGHDGEVTIEYTLYADHADGTYSGVDPTHAHLNMPATFLWARGLEERPIRITFHPPATSRWKVATQLVPTDDPFTFTAPDRAYFLDSPTELSDFRLREWTVESGGRSLTLRLAVHHEGSPTDVDRFAEMVRRVVRAQTEIFGELPDFDYGTYTFIADYLPWVFGDGMEHRNSTILTSTRPLAGDGALRNLGTVSHEFFHAWNMERIRSAALEPFDFEEAEMSRELWFGEGFTSYYDDVALARAGLRDLDAYAAGVGGSLSGVITSPARRLRSPVEMSMYAPFVDEAEWVDPQNLPNTFVSYYTWGSVVALGLDLTLRTRFDDLTLDDYMRAVWARHGRTGRPYTMEDLETVLAEVTGDAPFAEEFFARYVRGREVVDYGELLAAGGLVLRKRNPGAPWIGGARIVDGAGGALVASPTLVGSPLYRAGLDRGARVVSLDRRAVRSARDVSRIVSEHRPGDRVRVEFESRGSTRTAPVVLVEDPALEVVTFERAGREVSDRIRDFREAWLGVGVPGAAPAR